MGQKANPISLRLHVNRDFESSWYQDKNYSNLLKQELQIRQYTKSLFYFMKIYEGRTLFQFFPKKLVIYSFITNKQSLSKKHENPSKNATSGKTSFSFPEKKKNIRIKRSTKQEAILFVMQYILYLKQWQNVNCSNLQYPLFLYFISKFSHKVKNKQENNSQFISKSFYDNVVPQLEKSTHCTTSMFPIKLQSKYQSASFLAQYIAECFEKNLGFRQIYKQIQKDILKDKHILGLKIQCSGRIQGAEIAKVESKKMGQTSLHTFSASVDFAKAEAYTLYGIIGIKVWISCSSLEIGKKYS